MGPPRRSRSPAQSQSRACLNCQKRKSRCLLSRNGGGPCSYCSRTGKTCSFVNPPDRTPLTRRNLDAAELRCVQLQSLLQSLHPHLDIDAAIANFDSNGPNNPPNLDFEDTQAEIEADQDQPAHEFEWHESALPIHSGSPAGDLRMKDGMATLSTLDAGYLGSSSGSNLLQEIASMLPELATPSVSSEHHSNNSPGTWRSRRAPENILDPPGLASSAITGHLIDAYFLFYNVSYPILHERTFREKVASRQQRRSKSSWNVIYFMVLAVGHWISTTDAHHEQSKYYSAARSYLSIQMLESGTVETVQAFLLMGNYLQKIDRPNTGYNFVGIAYKMALGLGMHRETPGVEDNIGHERRRQLFWTVYCFDSGFNITTGRPPNVSEGVVDTRIPLNIQDKDLPLISPVPAPVDCPTTLSAIIAQAQLARLANVLYHEFLLAKTVNAKLEYQVAEATERNLTSWRQNLPSYFTSPDVPTWFLGPRAVVLWKEQNLRIILWRGSTRYHSFLPSKMDAEKRCLEVAMQSIHDIATFCRADDGILHLGIAWYATYFLFQAALVLEASYLDKENQQRSDDETAIWQVVVAEARECLVTLSQKSKSASRCLEVLDLIHRRTQTRNIIEHGHTAAHPGELLGGYQPQQPLPVDAEAATIVGGVGSECPVPVNEFGLYDDTSDLTLRMILDQTPWGYLDNTPMDAMFNDWIYPQFELQNDS
ncbi:fungal-specific transcription factor domain-containing protein [Dactylonectria macrodidyma]|uniref:Fungal-specific transcription factor domain-containing protein n=1 Tax=Dactylonectria macrodidyma TaxID=307937 RepID=A0A9P9F5N0_9HYPO|nr:fungal-specific transcription factor domain-containing protein [Dactylonectria macrodidyma]